ncbi:MAG: three component ABC system middle component [Crinalium sp.]
MFFVNFSIKLLNNGLMVTSNISYLLRDVDFAHRVRELLPISKETLAFLLQIGALTLDDEAGLRPTDYKRKLPESQKQNSIKDFYNKAELLGKWFARAGNVATIYALWGIKP